MVVNAAITNALTADGIIPDVLPPGTVVPRNLKVSFHTTTLTRPGQMIDREETQLKPIVFVGTPSLSEEYVPKGGLRGKRLNEFVPSRKLKFVKGPPEEK